MRRLQSACFVLAMLAWAPGAPAWAGEVVAHARPRPPELTTENGKISGPLKDILDEAMTKAGIDLRWQAVPFARSLKDMQDGNDAIVPRVRRTADREAFVVFLGPIVDQRRNVNFLVRKGKAPIKAYEDLAALTVGIKRGSVYFDRFDADKTLKKLELADDENLVNMLTTDRIDVVATLDKPALDAAIRKGGVTDTVYADYQEIMNEGNYFGVGKASDLAKRADEFNRILSDMVKSGRIVAIYGKYGLNPEKIE